MVQTKQEATDSSIQPFGIITAKPLRLAFPFRPWHALVTTPGDPACRYVVGSWTKSPVNILRRMLWLHSVLLCNASDVS